MWKVTFEQYWWEGSQIRSWLIVISAAHFHLLLEQKPAVKLVRNTNRK